jgi:hypothetical protein
MGKYDPLEGHLRRQTADEVDMSFIDIERIVGAMLPAAASRPGWWANQSGPPRTHVQCSAWLNCGFHAHPYEGRDRVVFRRQR